MKTYCLSSPCSDCPAIGSCLHCCWSFQHRSRFPSFHWFRSFPFDSCCSLDLPRALAAFRWASLEVENRVLLSNLCLSRPKNVCNYSKSSLTITWLPIPGIFPLGLIGGLGGPGCVSVEEPVCGGVSSLPSTWDACDVPAAGVAPPLTVAPKLLPYGTKLPGLVIKGRLKA